MIDPNQPSTALSSSSGAAQKPTPIFRVVSHHSPHTWFTPTHLHLRDDDGQSIDWQSRRSRKGRYRPAGHRVDWGQGPSGGAFGAGDSQLPGEVSSPSQSKRQSQDGRQEQGSLQNENKRQGQKTSSTGQTVYLRVPGRSKPLRRKLNPDVSFWIAVAFTAGSVVWVINGFLTWLPFVYPSLSTDAMAHAASALAFIGGIIFEVGSYLMVVEALDRGRETNFGTALSLLLQGHRSTPRPIPKSSASSSSLSVDQGATFPNQSGSRRVGSRTSIVKGRNETGPSKRNEQLTKRDAEEARIDAQEWPAGAKGFVWWGKPLWHDVGYVAAAAQLCAASVFWIATLTGLPGVIPGMSEGHHVAIADVFFWTSQVIGGTGFVISSTLLILEVQHKWYIPRPLDIGWQVGFWNLIGALGFLLCGALGYSSSHRAEYQSALATFWGSWAFLIGSGAQCVEVVRRDLEE